MPRQRNGKMGFTLLTRNEFFFKKKNTKKLMLKDLLLFINFYQKVHRERDGLGDSGKGM